MKCNSTRVFAVLSTVAFITVVILSCYLLWLCMFQLSLFTLEQLVSNTTQPSAKVGTVSYTTSAPLWSMCTTIDHKSYTLIKPSTVFTTVYLGHSKGFDTTTFGPKPGSYVTHIKPILFSGKPYNFRHLPKFLRPQPVWNRGV